MEPLSAAIIGGATVIGSALGIWGQDKTNEQNLYMANTQYQRRGDDLRAAGMNPIYATGAGAGSSPVFSNPMSGAGEIAEKSSSSAMAFAKTKQEIKNAEMTQPILRETEKKIHAEGLTAHHQQQMDGLELKIMKERYPGLLQSAKFESNLNLETYDRALRSVAKTAGVLLPGLSKLQNYSGRK